ncbi:MAG: DegV family protein [Clostridia bacterium]|nr:DegV family protein [Clostridia bacterium]
MREDILIASDSTTDLSPELIEKYGIKIIPMGVNLGDKHFTDGVDIDPDAIYAHYEKTGELPKTAAINIADFEDFFRKNTKNYKNIIFFTISSEMSSTFANARLAAESFEGVYAVDTRNLSTGGGLLLIRAAEMAESGMEAEDIVKACNEIAPRVDASFIIDDLEFLHKGGRCSALAAFGANLLQLKPCIVVDNGKMSVGKKYRGKFAAVLDKYISERIGDGSNIEKDHVFVTHAGCDEEIVNECVRAAKECMPDANVHITRAGCTISSHCGRNTLGILFIKKN